MTKKSKVKIIGDGTPSGTVILVDGKELSDVVSLEITRIDINNCATAIITVLNPELDLVNINAEFKDGGKG